MIGSSRTVYLAHKRAYELFLVLKLMEVYLSHARQYGVTIVVPLHYNLHAFFLFWGVIVVTAVGL